MSNSITTVFLKFLIHSCENEPKQNYAQASTCRSDVLGHKKKLPILQKPVLEATEETVSVQEYPLLPPPHPLFLQSLCNTVEL